jgi:uncharacterized protein YjbI with pentapeptide repeats
LDTATALFLIEQTRDSAKNSSLVNNMDAEELLQRYAAGERDFSGVDLSGVNLNIGKLDKYDPSRNNLSGINLSGANLTRADMRCVNLSRLI